jgi:hypothetical protein
MQRMNEKKRDLLEDVTNLNQKVGEEEVDHKNDGRTNSDFNHAAGTV